MLWHYGLPPEIDFANFKNLVELELCYFGTYESGPPVNLSHHQKLEHLILMETELKTESNESRTVFRNSNFRGCEKMLIIICVCSRKFEKNKSFSFTEISQSLH